MKKITIIAIIIGAALVVAALVLSSEKTPATNKVSTDSNATSNVTIEDGKQIVDIAIRGGYSPKLTEAKADVPTILRMKTENTFDCTSVLNIPALSYQKNLPSTGITEVEVPPQKAGSTLEGLCGMGMYRFEIAFK